MLMSDSCVVSDLPLVSAIKVEHALLELSHAHSELDHTPFDLSHSPQSFSDGLVSVFVSAESLPPHSVKVLLRYYYTV